MTGVHAATPDEVEAALLRLIDDAAERERIGRQAHEYVAEHRRIEVAAESWREVLTSQDPSRRILRKSSTGPFERCRLLRLAKDGDSRSHIGLPRPPPLSQVRGTYGSLEGDPHIPHRGTDRTGGLFEAARLRSVYSGGDGRG